MNINEYQAVESNYAAKWQGIILYKGLTKKRDHLRLVLLILDKNGHRIRKRQTKIIDYGWLKTIEPLDIDINSDWLVINSSEVVELNYDYGEVDSLWQRFWNWIKY